MENLNDMLFDTRADPLINPVGGSYRMSEGLQQAAEETKLKIREAFQLVERNATHQKMAKHSKTRARPAKITTL